MEKKSIKTKSPTKSSPARSISSVSSKNSKKVDKNSPYNDDGNRKASSNVDSNMVKPSPLPDLAAEQHDTNVIGNEDGDSYDVDTHNIPIDHGIKNEVAIVKEEEKAQKKHSKSVSVFQRLAETPIHHLSTEVKSSPTKTLSIITKTKSSSPTKTKSSSPSPTKKPSPSPTKSSPARSISSVSSKKSKKVDNNDDGKKKASSNVDSNMVKPSPLPDLAVELDDDLKGNENEDNENDKQNDTDFSIYFDNIPIEEHGNEVVEVVVEVVKEEEKAANYSTLASLDLDTDMQTNLNQNNNDVVDKHAKSVSVFQRLAETPIHHLSTEVKSSQNQIDHKQFSNDQHQHHYHNHTHQIHENHENRENHENHIESVFERLSHTPIHHLTDREKLDIQESVVQGKPISPTKRVTHTNLHVSNRIQGLTPEVKSTAGTVVHAVVLLTTVPPLVDMQDKVLSEEIDYNVIAMGLLEDRINTISKLKSHSGNKLIVAIPDRIDQKNNMNNILEKMNLKKYWSILTIPHDVPSLKDAASGNLTELLKYTLKILGPSLKKGSISFTSSDCPTLHFTEIICGQNVASDDNNFYISPAQDGGYCLLTVPAATPPEIFDNVIWSNDDTCIQQILALRKVSTESPQKKKQIVIVGKTHRDIDNIEDIRYLKDLIKNNRDKEFEKDFPKTIGVLNRLVLD